MAILGLTFGLILMILGTEAQYAQYPYAQNAYNQNPYAPMTYTQNPYARQTYSGHNRWFIGGYTRSDYCQQEGYAPHPESCAKFVRCVNMGPDNSTEQVLVRFDFDCAPGTIYDPSLEICNHPEDTPNRAPGCEPVYPAVGEEPSNQLDENPTPPEYQYQFKPQLQSLQQRKYPSQYVHQPLAQQIRPQVHTTFQQPQVQTLQPGLIRPQVQQTHWNQQIRPQYVQQPYVQQPQFQYLNQPQMNTFGYAQRQQPFVQGVMPTHTLGVQQQHLITQQPKNVHPQAQFNVQVPQFQPLHVQPQGIIQPQAQHLQFQGQPQTMTFHGPGVHIQQPQTLPQQQ